MNVSGTTTKKLYKENNGKKKVNEFHIYRSKVNAFAADLSDTSPSLNTHFPFKRVRSTEPLKVIPSKGDQPHLYKIFYAWTLLTLFILTTTKSAKYPSFKKPLSLISNKIAGL